MRLHNETLLKFSQLLSAMVLALMVSLSADAQYIVQQTAKLLPGDGAAGDRFGESTAISGTTAIVGAMYDDDNGPESGSAFLFDVTTGQTFQLLPNDGVAEDEFGKSVAISGNIAIVGAWRDGDHTDWKTRNTGAAYLFDTTTGLQIAKLVAEDGSANDYFGESVGISGTTAIVGGEDENENGYAAGAAYLFDVTTGQQIAKLLPDDGADADVFGRSVDINETTAIVGAPLDDDNGDRSGSAYFFDVTTRQQLAKLLPNDGAAYDYFGQCVAISGTTAIIGAWGDDDNGDSSGSAYLFDVSTGEQTKLLPNDGAAGERFGWSVAISGNTAIVGAYRDDDNGDRSGSAYFFDVTTGQQIAKLLPNDSAAYDYFGRNVAISGTTAIIGALGNDENGENSGSAYLFNEPSERIIVTASSAPRLVTTEAGGQDSFEVVLNSPPAFPVTIGITSADPSQGTTDVSSVRFTETDWNIPQTVTVTGVDNQDYDGDVFYAIITAAATSDDSYFDGEDACDIGVVNQDNEQTSYYSEGINNNVLIPDKGTASSWIEVTNDFLISDVNVTLNIFHERNEDLDVYLIAPDGTAVELFTDAGGTAQGFLGVTLDDEAYSVIGSYRGTPGTYRPEGNLGDFDSANSIGFWTLQVTDDRSRMTGKILDWSLEFRGLAFEPTPGISVSPTSGLLTTEAGGWDEFTIVLDTQPSADVTIGISSDNTNEGIVDKSSLTFTPDIWDSAQTVTITGVDDDPVNETGDDQYNIVIAAATSTDLAYDGMDPDDVSVTNLDNDGPLVYSSDDTPLAIPDFPRSGIESTIPVTDDFQISGLTVTLNISHPRPDDLTVFLIGPNDQAVPLPNFSGDNPVADFNGTRTFGQWTLEVVDHVKKKKGTLNSWSITVDY